MPKAYSYIRFSSPQQAKGDSFRRQLELATTYAKVHGLELAESKEYTFFDSGKSGYKAKHLDAEGQLRRFLDLVEEGEIAPGSYLLVESLDRLSREKVQKALPRFIDLLNKGIHVVTLSDGKLYRGGDNVEPTDILISLVMMMRAHEESATKGDRVSASWANKQQQAREGKALGNVGPAWLQLIGEQYQPIADRVAVVQRIYQLAAAGAGAAQIAAQLNQDNVPTFGKSLAWGTTSVRKLLTFRAVLGEYQPLDRRDGEVKARGEPIANYYPAIIEEPLFYQVQGLLAIRSTSRPSKQTTQVNLWHGIAKCFECGASMQVVRKGQPPKGFTYLTCYQSRSGGCKAKAIRIELADAVMPELLVRVDSLSLVQSSAKARARELDECLGRLAKIEEKTRTTAELHAEFPSRATAIQLQALEVEHGEIHARLEKAKASSMGGDALTKEEFLSQLTLHDNESRTAANILLKRLELKAFFQRQSNPAEFSVWVSTGDRPPRPFLDTAAFNQLLFIVHHNREAVSVQTFDDDQIDRQVKLGEIGETDAIIAKAEGFDDPSIPAEVRRVLHERYQAFLSESGLSEGL